MGHVVPAPTFAIDAHLGRHSRWFRNASDDKQPWPALKLPGESSAGLSPTEADSGHADKSSPNTFPGMNLIVLLASILTCARVIGVTSLQAFRTAILEVPNPSNLTLFASLTPCLTASIMAAPGLARGCVQPRTRLSRSGCLSERPGLHPQPPGRLRPAKACPCIYGGSMR